MIGPSIPKEILETRRKSASKEKNFDNESSDDSEDDIVGPQFPKTQSTEQINTESTHNHKKEECEKQDSGFVDPEMKERDDEEKVSVATRKEDSLLDIHRAKTSTKNKITKFDSKDNLNSEIRKEILRKLDQNGGLKGKFTRGS